MKFSIYQDSRQGPRKMNQDRVAYAYTRDSLMMVVADGMGGHLHGELAAQIAARAVAEAFRREARPRLSDPVAFLRDAVLDAHRAIVRSAADGALAETPRTTCIACVVQDNAACWAHAGDSRLYHIRDGRIIAQTRDHSLVQQLIDSGRIREQAVAAHPERNRIFNCLGSARLPRVDVGGPVPLYAGDTLLLCSDGLWGPLSAASIGSAVMKRGIMHALPDLLDEAERRAGRECDNLSAIAMSWEQDSAAALTSAPAPAPALEAGVAAAHNDYLSDDEIERAIARIRTEMTRQRHDKT